MNHSDEHPLVVAMAWALAGAMFTIYVLIKMGAAGAMTSNNHVSETIELYEPRDFSTGNQEAD